MPTSRSVARLLAVLLVVLFSSRAPAAWRDTFAPPQPATSVNAVAAVGDLVATARWTSGQETEVTIWRDGAWSTLARFAAGTAVRLLGADDRFYLYGDLTETPGGPCSGIASWDGASWDDLDGGVDGTVTWAGKLGGFVIVAGDFSHAGDVAANHIAAWDGHAWSALGAGLPVPATALWADDQVVLAYLPANWGGNAEPPQLRRWWSGNWTSPWPAAPANVETIGRLGSELFLIAHPGGWSEWHLVSGAWAWVSSSDRVTGMAVFQGQLYAIKTDPAWPASDYAAVWTGSPGGAWVETGWGLGRASLKAIAADDGGLLVGGDFVVCGGSFQNLLRVDDGGVRGIPDDNRGLRSSVTMIAAAGGTVAVGSTGGDTQYGGGRCLSRALFWADGDWSDIPITESYLDRDVQDVCVDGGHWGVIANRSRWTQSYGMIYDPSSNLDGQLHLELDGPMYMALARWRDRWVIAQKASADSVTVLTNVPGNIHGYVEALHVFEDRLIVVGQFDRIGAVRCDGLASWDGATWSPLSAPIQLATGGGHSITTFDGQLVLAGALRLEDQPTVADQVAVLVDGHWRQIGADFDEHIGAIVAHQGRLVVGGHFTAAGTTPLNRLAVWDGAAWVSLGGGVNGHVTALASSPDGLWVGGTFTSTGDGTPAGNIAIWDGELVSVLVAYLRASWDDGDAQIDWMLGRCLEPGESLRLDAVSTDGSVRRLATLTVGGPAFSVRDGAARSGDVLRLYDLTAGAEPALIAETTLGPRPWRSMHLTPAVPNPANPMTRVTFTLPAPDAVDLAVFDLVGHRVRTLAGGRHEAGDHVATWDGRDGSGRELPSGTYLIRLFAADQQQCAKVALVR